MPLNIVQKISVWLLPIIFAVVWHEVAHGWVASKFGDQTAKMMGRLTLNPLKHIDWLGTVVIPLFFLVTGGFIFGWAKPVPISPRNFKHLRLATISVALAGPGANFIMAILWAMVAKLGLSLMATNDNARPIFLMGQAGIYINIFLGVINLLPILPLDGGRIVSCIIPAKAAYYYDKLEPFGFLIVLLLLITGALHVILGPLLIALSHFIIKLLVV